MTNRQRALEYRLTSVVVASTSFALFCAALGLSWVLSGDDAGLRWFAVGFLVLALAWAWRALRANALYTTSEGVVVQTLLRTYRLRWNELARFEVGLGNVGSGPSARAVLTAVTRDGARQQFAREINSKAAPAGQLSAMDRLAERLARLESYGGAP